MELILEIETRYKKYGDRYNCICEKLKLTGMSKESFEDAHDKLINMIELKVWGEEYTLKIRETEKK